MMMARYNRRWARAARRRRRAGLTLIEVAAGACHSRGVVGFLAGGLSIGRRAFDADRTGEISGETDAAIQAITS
jgi:general secretion pathway protein J